MKKKIHSLDKSLQLSSFATNILGQLHYIPASMSINILHSYNIKEGNSNCMLFTGSMLHLFIDPRQGNHLEQKGYPKQCQLLNNLLWSLFTDLK